MRVKKLNMNCDIDKQILLTYFFKNLNTVLDTKELLGLCTIHYDSKKEKFYSCTKRFKKELEPYKDTQVMQKNVDDTLKKVLSHHFKIQEELVRCDLHVDEGIDYFYITIIGADLFQIENEFGHKLDIL